jgi:hypothetical protein
MPITVAYSGRVEASSFILERRSSTWKKQDKLLNALLDKQFIRASFGKTAIRSLDARKVLLVLLAGIIVMFFTEC